MNPFYRDYSDFLQEHFEGKVQKISVNIASTCPNRDGSIGRGGCTYCNNQAFNPDYCSASRSVAEQIADGKRFFARKYPNMRYLAYFQAYTSTHNNTNTILKAFREALDTPQVVGLVIGTRPDCMPDRLLEQLAHINAHISPVFIEYGAESSHDATLTAVNRCHTWAQTVDAVTRTHAAGIHTGLHLILGLPDETEDMMLQTVDRISQLPISTVKFHQLQIIRGTHMARQYEQRALGATIFDPDQYIALCAKILKHLRSDIAVERFVSSSPDNLLIAPRWGLKNYEFTHRLLKALSEQQICETKI